MKNCLSYIQRVLLLAALALLSACGDELTVDDGEQQEQAIAESTAFAYISTDAATEGSAEAGSTNKQLMVRNSITSSAAEIEILTAFNNEEFSAEYDVQNLTISQDGETLLFSANNLQSDSSWNLFQYHFKSQQLQRIISDDNIANQGNDTHGIYSGNLILFSSDRGPTNEVRLFAMESDGSKIIEITQQLDTDTTTKISLLNVPNTGTNSVILEKGVDQEGISGGGFSTAFKGVAELTYHDIMQGSDGRILAIAKNSAHPMQGGEIVQLQGPAASESSVGEESNTEQDALFEYLVAKPLSSSTLVSGANDVAVNGWYSAYWPYR
ncbi:hypothetical protein A9R00_04980, partial [Oleispira antarctica]